MYGKTKPLSNLNSRNEIKTKKPSYLIEEEIIKKKELELKAVRELLNKSSNDTEEKELNNILNKSRKKSGLLKPVKDGEVRSKSKLNADPHKRLIDQMQMLSELNNNNDLSSSINSKVDTDREFRKTFAGKKEKIEIDCDPLSTNNSMMSKSLIRFDLDYDDNKAKASENKFNNLVRNQLILEYHQVNDFLDSIGLSKYLDVFIQFGIEDIDKIKQISEDKLKEMAVPYGHRVKILKKIGSNKKDKDEDNMRSLSQNIYEELPIENGTSVQSGGVGKDDACDEELQRRLFQEAVNEFRSGKKTEKDDKALITQNSELPAKGGKGFLYNIGGENAFDFNNFALFEENGSSAEVKNFLPFNKSKYSCWTCYKLIVDDSAQIRMDKLFCGKSCLEHFTSKFVITCDECGKEIEKNKSILYKSHYYCSEKCLNKVYLSSSDSSDSCEDINNGKIIPNDDEELNLYDPMNDF